MEIKGTVVLNNGIERGTSKSGKEWAKASLVVETEGQYPKKILLTHFKDADKFATLQVGAVGTFSVEIESREYNNRWYTEVSCWGWDVAQQQPAPTAYPTDPYAAAGMQPQQQIHTNPPQTDDLPF